MASNQICQEITHLSCVHSPLQLRCGKLQWSYFRLWADYCILILQRSELEVQCIAMSCSRSVIDTSVTQLRCSRLWTHLKYEPVSLVFSYICWSCQTSNLLIPPSVGKHQILLITFTKQIQSNLNQIRIVKNNKSYYTKLWSKHCSVYIYYSIYSIIIYKYWMFMREIVKTIFPEVILRLYTISRDWKSRERVS